MRNLLAVFLLLFAVRGPLNAQHQVVLELEHLPANSTADSIYAAGSFNGWKPGDERFRFQWVNVPLPNAQVGEASVRRLVVQLPKGRYDFKITHGGWEKVETGASGQDVDNRSLTVASDTTVRISVAGWKDRFASKPKQSTALPSVRIISSAFAMPQLGRSRRVWVCLPKNYEQGNRRYPVLYMHDGQNLFDESTGGFGEWGVDEAMDTLQQRVGGIIIVGIDHGGTTRINEYSPYDMERFGKGEGAAYTDFLVQTLKPWIDSAFRTRKGTADTYIAGSSMGGLISMYAILRYPGVFGGAGVFSPAFWVAPNLKRDILRYGSDFRGRVFFYAGEQESPEMVPDMLRIFQLLRQLSRAPMQTVIRSEGKHNEATWRKEFPGFVEWIMKKPPTRPMPKF